MKIILINTGYIDIANQLVKKAKSRFLKKVLLVSRDRYSINKYHGKIPLLDYSRINYNRDQTPLGIETELMETLRDEYRQAVSGSGDIFFVTGCETQEIAALKVIQSVCEETGTRFHVLFIAPFLFEGQKRSQLLKTMLESMSEYYDSISLYYPDELLRIQNNKNKAAGEKERSFDLHQAYDALEEEAANLLMEISKQIPKLNILMQYTYDFELKEFSLAVDPLGLLLNMWGSVSNDADNFRSPEEAEQKIGVLETAAGQIPGEAPKDIPQIGIFAPDRDKVKKISAYKSVTRNSIPVGAYRKQVNESSLDRLVEGIKDLLGSEYNRPVDPEKRKKAQERLRREIEKFQIRQAEAEDVYSGEQPTTMRSLDVALMDIYLDEGTAAEEGVQGNARVYMETPFQRAAKAAQNKEKPTSWIQIKADRDAAMINDVKAEELNKQTVTENISYENMNVATSESNLSGGTAPYGMVGAGLEATPASVQKINEATGYQGMSSKKAADFSKLSTASANGASDFADSVESNVSNGAEISDVSAEIAVADDADMLRGTAVPESTHKYVGGEGTRLNVKESVKKTEATAAQDLPADNEKPLSRREERQRDKLRKKLAKAEERAEAARAKAEAALREASEAAREVEIIAREHEEEN